MRRSLFALIALALSACATLPDPVNVSVAGIDSLPGEGLELRLLVKLRIQNPNDLAVSFKGASVRMDVQQRAFATGVTNIAGTLPALGEAVVEVPVTVSAWNIVRQVLGVVDGQARDRIRYSMSGRLHTGGLGGLRFGTQGELDAPADWVRSNAATGTP
jgi:LEA14-like dessication related protein